MNDLRRYARQIPAFGAAGQATLGNARIGIVGLGGLGSQLAQGLSYLGARHFVLVDDDVVDETSLNRLVGAVPSDVGRPKVQVAARHIADVAPAADVSLLAMDLRTRETLERLRCCDLILAGVDRDAPRLVLTELAAAYRIPLIDTATEIFVTDGKIAAAGGRVVLARPGRYCLLCARQLDLRSAAAELTGAAARAVAQTHGYGLGDDAPAPSVVALNGVIANLALMEALALVTGWREPRAHLTYDALRGIVLARTVATDPGCYVCMALAGQDDEAAVIDRYATASAAA